MNASNLYYGTRPLAEDKLYYAIIDSGSSQIYVPPRLFDELKVEWKRTIPNIICNNDSCHVHGGCANVA